MSDTAQSIKVWDPFVRIFHWSLVICVMVNNFVIDDGEDLHQWLGYIACTLVSARIVWGFVGTRYARFADFFPTPQRIRTHFHALRTRQEEDYAGHNPLGALMMLTLIALVLALGLSGYLQTTDRFWGEEWLQELHAMIAQVLISLAGLHALAAIAMSRIERTNLVWAMITGTKTRR